MDLCDSTLSLIELHQVILHEDDLRGDKHHRYMQASCRREQLVAKETASRRCSRGGVILGEKCLAGRVYFQRATNHSSARVAKMSLLISSLQGAHLTSEKMGCGSENSVF